LLKVVYFGFPVRSHTAPSLAIVRELVTRGVEVEYYSTARFRSMIESAGARFTAYPAICDSLCDPTDLAGHVERVAEVAVQILPELLAAGDRRAAFVIFDASALWGRVIARHRGAVSIVSITTFAFTRSMLQILGAPDGGRGWAGPRVADLLSRLNRYDAIALRDGLDVLVAVGDLKLVCTSRFFQPGGRFFDDSYLFVGPLFEPGPRDGARAESAGPRPLAYVSLGTIFNRDLDLLKNIGGMLSNAGWQVAVSLGEAGREVCGAWPEHVGVYSFVDQMAMLSQASLFVTHGGMGSVSEALANGVPMIVVPQGVDQFLVARRTAELGAAVVIEPHSASAPQWQAALGRMATERATFAAAAARIGQSFSDVTPVACAAERMLGLSAKEGYAAGL
jgi:MGT family glycosyltransferase